MAIAFGAITGASNSGTSLTFSSPNVSGSDTLGLVSFTRDVASNPVTNVTWNGTAMTFIDYQFDNFGANGSTGVGLWYILNPTAGVTNVVVSASNGSNRAKAAFYTGVKQTGQPDASNKGNVPNGTTNLALTVTTVADNSWSILVGRDINGNALQSVSNATIRVPSTDNAIGFFDSNSDITPAGNFTMTVKTASGSFPKNGVIASFAPAVSAPANNGFMQWWA